MSENHSTTDSIGAETDEQLMAAFCRGSAEAFHALFQRYKQPVFGYFYRRVGDRAEAEELAQETFVALLGARNRYQAAALFRTWLYSVALNILRAHRRKSIFRGLLKGNAVDVREPAAPANLEAEITLREAVRKLDGLEREFLLLREFEELSYAEIAAILHIPLNTVRSRLFRARTALRNVLIAPAPGQRESQDSSAPAEVRVEEHA